MLAERSQFRKDNVACDSDDDIVGKAEKGDVVAGRGDEAGHRAREGRDMTKNRHGPRL